MGEQDSDLRAQGQCLLLLRHRMQLHLPLILGHGIQTVMVVFLVEFVSQPPFHRIGRCGLHFGQQTAYFFFRGFMILGLVPYGIIQHFQLFPVISGRSRRQCRSHHQDHGKQIRDMSIRTHLRVS